jgi:iron complex transport system ATP-binding protein
MTQLTRSASLWHPAGDRAALTLRDVTVRYGAYVALDEVSLTVVPGQWTALIGPNGAGKTSLLHAITGAVACHGTIAVGDDHLTTLHARARARRVALVPQRPVMPDAMTVADYVLLGRTAHLSYLGVEGTRDRQVVAETLERLGLRALAGRAVSTLSGGEQQRVVLARALAQQTPVLLLDEPTSALDIGHRQQVLQLVDVLRRECLLTVLAAMHDLTLAAQYADHLVLLDRARIAARGTPRDVLTAERVAAHFDADVHVLDTPDGGLALVPARPRP